MINQLNNDAGEYRFIDQKVLAAVKALNAIQLMGIIQLEQFSSSVSDDPTNEFYQLQLNRYEQVVKSSLSLAIVELAQALNIDSPFTAQSS